MVRGVVRIAFCVGLLVGLCGFGLPCSANEVVSGASLHTHIDASIDQLGATSFQLRETATRELLQRGSSAIPRLEMALPIAKGEVRYRIRSILDQQRRSSDQWTQRAAEQALTRIARGNDKASATWARSILPAKDKAAEMPVAVQSSSVNEG